MSNIGKTSANIKKKLSFGDYRKSAKQQGGKKAKQSTNKQVSRPAVKTVHRTVSKPAEQPVVKTVPHHDVTPPIHQTVIPAMQQSVTPSVQQISNKVSQHTNVPAQQQASPKTKATFYLGEEENTMLTELFIQGLTASRRLISRH